MRPLKSHFPPQALTTLDTMPKPTTEARVFRRAQAVHAVVAGHHGSAVSATCHWAPSAWRKWGQRFAQEGPQGGRDRPRSGRPSQVPCALEQPRQPHHPSEGCWRVMEDPIGAGRCFGALQELYQLTRRVLMAHQERPI